MRDETDDERRMKDDGWDKMKRMMMDETKWMIKGKTNEINDEMNDEGWDETND